jgi:DNA polymerase-3 subunit epsilon
MLFSSPPWDSVVYWALDLETGGLDVRQDPILAVGMVPLRQGVIRLGESFATLVRPPRAEAINPASIRAHQLVWGEVREAPHVVDVLRTIDGRLREGVLLVHESRIDVAFLKKAYAGCGLRWPAPPVVDTVNLLWKAARMAHFTDPNPPEPTLNLAAARAELGLPSYPAHDALTDAISAAELFLVLRRKLGARKLRDLR